MTENIEERTCDDCGRVVTNRRDECPICRTPLRSRRKRRDRLFDIDAEHDWCDESDPSYESRLEEGFLMLEWE